MLVFAHSGIALKLKKNLSVLWVLIGSLIPDLIDKPLYYLFKNDLITGTRTFFHTVFLFVCFFSLSMILKSKNLKAFSIGMGIHIILDILTDWVGLTLSLGDPVFNYHVMKTIESLEGHFWPVFGNHFYVKEPTSFGVHIYQSVSSIHILIAEIYGLFLWKKNYSTWFPKLWSR